MRTIAVRWLRLALPIVLTITSQLSHAETLFTHESEAGIVITAGNADSQSYNFKQNTKYTHDGNVVKLYGHFVQTTSNGVQSARNWDLGLRYERQIWMGIGAYLGQNIEADPFAGYSQRYNTDIGGQYFIIKEEDLVWSTEAGYRLSVQNAVNRIQNTDHLLRAYTEVTRSWDKRFSVKYWLEALPNLTTSSAYRLNTELSLSSVLTSIFSIKVGYGIRYNNAPPAGAAKKTDTTFTTALVAKF